MKQRLEFLNLVTQSLEEKRDSLLAKSDSAAEEGARLEKEVKDRGDEAQSLVMEQLENTLQMNDIDELRKVEKALEALKQGQYGVCSECNEPISQKRLEHYPYALRCISCQEAFEG